LRLSVGGGAALTLSGGKEGAAVFSGAADKDDANLILGAVIDPRLEGVVRITVLATGFDSPDYNVRHHKLAPEPEKHPEPKDEPLRFSLGDREMVPESELDIPAFLRRR